MATSLSLGQLGILETLRYSLPMRIVPLAIIAVVGIAMFSLQISGLHMHVSVQGDASGLHGAHVHQLDTDGHDHGGDLDVSVLDPGTVWSKIMPVLLLAYSILLAVVWTRQWFWPPPQHIFSPRRRSRWRPPLRAPPLSP